MYKEYLKKYLWGLNGNLGLPEVGNDWGNGVSILEKTNFSK